VLSRPERIESILEEHRPRLVLIDYHMSRLLGSDVARQILSGAHSRSDENAPRLVVMTSEPSSAIHREIDALDIRLVNKSDIDASLLKSLVFE